MSIEYVSVENNKNHSLYRPPELDNVEESNKKSTKISYSKELSAEARANKSKIFSIIKVLNDNGLDGNNHVKDYLLSLNRRNCRPNTIRTNGCAIILFLTFLKAKGKDKLEIITREDLNVFIENEQDRGLKPNSVNTRLRVLNTFLKFMIEREVIHPDVLKRKMRIKIPDSLPRAIDPEDVRKFLSVVTDTRNRAIILVLLRTGMRIGELLNTKVEDINLKEKRIEIIEAQKNRVGRVVYISDDARGALNRWLKTRNMSKSQYVFYGQRAESLCYEAAREMFNRYMEKAGLSHKGYTLHCLRHTFASEMLNASMPLECLQELLGHSDIEMTRRYARLTDNTRKEEYFRAMTIIEKGDINGQYRCNYQLS